jgi:hypothetical protein
MSNSLLLHDTFGVVRGDPNARSTDRFALLLCQQRARVASGQSGQSTDPPHEGWQQHRKAIQFQASCTQTFASFIEGLAFINKLVHMQALRYQDQRISGCQFRLWCRPFGLLIGPTLDPGSSAW